MGGTRRYKEEYLLTRPASKVLGEAGAVRRWTTICKQLLSSLKAKFSSFIYFRFLIIISSIFSVAALHFVSCLSMSLCLQHFRVPAPSAHFNEFVVNMCAIYLQAPLATWRARPPPCSSQSAHCPRFCTLFFLRLARLFCC